MGGRRTFGGERASISKGNSRRKEQKGGQYTKDTSMFSVGRRRLERRFLRFSSKKYIGL